MVRKYTAGQISPVYPDGESELNTCYRLYPYENQAYSLFRGIRYKALNGYDLFCEPSKRHDMTDDVNSPEYASGMAAFESRNFSLAVQFLSPLAEAGSADAQHRVAIMCQNGLGMVRNEARAFDMMKAAAEQGLAIAQHGVGFMYMEGDCVEQNSAEAVNWFRKAADQGLAGSLTTLAQMYEDGNGVEKDQEEAKRLYAEAGFDL